jgi:hypothetical protein
MGFTFDDTNPTASPVAEMHRLIAKDARNALLIHPFIGGQEINSSPTQEPQRWVINFEDKTEEQAKAWPDLYDIVRRKVLPEREGKDGGYSRRWWLYGRSNKKGTEIMKTRQRVLTIAQTSNSLGFVFQPADRVFAHTVVIFPLAEMHEFCLLQSRIHQIWTLFFCAKMKDDARYIPTDCFETFPFPGGDGGTTMTESGRQYHDFRAELMVRNSEGLTKTYNRFHDPNEAGPDILRLRELHDAMDRAVLDAYGWADIQPKCEFLLDYEEDEDAEETTSHRKKPWRYRWPDDIRDEVLARLLKLNAERAEEERRTGEAAAAAEKAKRPKRSRAAGRKLNGAGTRPIEFE